MATYADDRKRRGALTSSKNQRPGAHGRFGFTGKVGPYSALEEVGWALPGPKGYRTPGASVAMPHQHPGGVPYDMTRPGRKPGRFGFTGEVGPYSAIEEVLAPDPPEGIASPTPGGKRRITPEGEPGAQPGAQPGGQPPAPPPGELMQRRTDIMALEDDARFRRNMLWHLMRQKSFDDPERLRLAHEWQGTGREQAMLGRAARPDAAPMTREQIVGSERFNREQMARSHVDAFRAATREFEANPTPETAAELQRLTEVAERALQRSVAVPTAPEIDERVAGSAAYAARDRERGEFARFHRDQWLTRMATERQRAAEAEAHERDMLLGQRDIDVLGQHHKLELMGAQHMAALEAERSRGLGSRAEAGSAEATIQQQGTAQAAQDAAVVGYAPEQAMANVATLTTALKGTMSDGVVRGRGWSGRPDDAAVEAMNAVEQEVDRLAALAQVNREAAAQEAARLIAFMNPPRAGYAGQGLKPLGLLSFSGWSLANRALHARGKEPRLALASRLNAVVQRLRALSQDVPQP